MKKKVRKIFLFVATILFAMIEIACVAQPGDPAGDPDTVPIPGIQILLGLGCLVGIIRLRDLRRKEHR